MSENKRVKDFFVYLRQHDYVRNQQHFVEKIGSDKSTISQVMNDRIPVPKGLFSSIAVAFPFVNINWLLTGEGEMLKKSATADDIVSAVDNLTLVPLFNLEAVAGFEGSFDQEYVEELMPWGVARKGDFAVHVTGDSMTPRIPNGSILLVRPYAIVDFEDLNFGRVHIVVTSDDRAMVKVIKIDHERPGHMLLVSYNEAYPVRSIPISEIRHIYLAVAVQAPL